MVTVNSPFVAHRLDRVEQQIHERLLQLRLVAAHRVRRGVVMAVQHDQSFGHLVLQQPQRVVEQVVNTARSWTRRTWAR